MNKLINITLSLGIIALLGSCSKEDPFVSPDYDGPTGTLITRCLAPTLSNPEGLEVATRAEVPSADDFNVVITRQGDARNNSSVGSVEYKYSDMPEVLTLPTGEYKVYASHGENEPCAWDSPYYYGESTFGIEENKITDDVDPIVAKLSNIRVTIVFHPSLLSAISEDSKVEVKVGDQGMLEFTPSEKRSAYFKYVRNSQSLTATFTGMVDGSEVVLSKTYDNAAPGNHYRITFRLHGIDDDAPGTITGGVTVDASIEMVDMNHTVDGEPEEILTDDWRPTQGGGNTDPDDPNPPVVEPSAPQITSATPPANQSNLKPVVLGEDKVNQITPDIYCVLHVKSTAENGIEKFDVKIDSEQLNKEELEGFGLAQTMDLVNPENLEGPLTGLGLPVNVGGMHDVDFDITKFMTMLEALGEGTHKFILTVGDANGETTSTLVLQKK